MPDAGLAQQLANGPQSMPDTLGLPHVCFVAPTTWPVFSGDTRIDVVGGAEVQQSILARLLARAGYPVSMICLDYGQPTPSLLDGVSIYKTHRPEAGWPVLRFIHPRMTSMWRAMAEANADIYYQRAAGMLTAVVAEFCRRHGRKSIYAGASDHDFIPGFQDIRYRRDRWLFERGLARVDRLVVQNETQQRCCLEHYGRTSTLIRSCYDLPGDARPAMGSGRSVLWVGSMHRNKRPELFLELARQLPGFRFVMIGGPAGGEGDADYFTAIRDMAASLPNVECTGFLPLAQVEPYFDRAAILVNTSTHEGMPNTFLQAWARSVPSVAFVDTGARLRGSPVYSVVSDIAQAKLEIERLLTDQVHWRRMANHCRDYFNQTYGPESVLADYGRLFKSLVGAGSQHA